MKHVIVVLSFLIVLVSGIFANPQTIVLKNETSNSTEISDRSWDGFILDVKVGEVNANKVQTIWGNFAKLELPDFNGYQMEIGKANLPTINQLIDIPYNAVVQVKVLSSEMEEIQLSEFDLSEIIMPYQGPIEKTENALQDHVFQMDNKYYSLEKYDEQPLVTFDNIGNMRGHQIGQIKINAVQYNPAKNKIRVYKNIKIKVDFINADINQTESTHRKYKSSAFDIMFKEYLVNYESIESDLTQYPVHYVIIYHDAFETALQPFIEWKEQKGFTVTAERISVIGNNTSAITSYISGLYAGANPPSFVLLVGDREQIETHNGQEGSHVTDLYYTTMTTGDYIPDLYIGRLSAQTEAQLTAQLDKILPYEKYQLNQTAFLNHGTFPATSDGGNYQVAEGTHNYVIDNHFIPNGLLYDKLYAITYGSTGHDVLQALNAGRFIINYSGHGSTTSWAGPSVTQSMVNSSTNNGMYPFIISNACVTGSFNLTECFGETWVRKANGGGLAFTGASNNTMWGEDDAWERRAYDGTFWENYHSLAAFILRGNLAVLNAGYSAAKYYFEIYHLFGDPSLMLYWGEPLPMTVSCNPVVPLGSTDFTVNIAGEDSALVALYMNGDLFGTALTDAAGLAQVQFDNPPITPGEMTLTVTKFNKQPFIDTLQVIVPSFVTFQPDTIQINTLDTINVTVMDADTLNPEIGAQVWVEGVGYCSDTTLTDSSGLADVFVNSAYGPNLILKIKRPADNYFLFTDTVTVVGGLLLDSPDLWVNTTFGLNDAFAMNLPGTLNKSSVTATTDLLYSINNSEWVSTSEDSVIFTPDVVGNVSAVIAKSGYNIYSEDFPIIIAYGHLSGIVTDTAANALTGVTVDVYDDTLLLGSVVTNATGDFTFPDSLPVADYNLRITQFGYLTIDTTYFIGYGLNQLPISMTPAPSGVVSGMITELGTNFPVEATIRIYRSDNQELYVQTTSDSTGNYSVNLPFFNYKMVTNSLGYKSDIQFIDIDSLAYVINIELVPGLDDYIYDFEADDGGFSSTASWAWGVPSSGPGSAYQGTKLWATNLSGEYGDSEHAELISQPLDLSGFVNPKLQFAHWYDIEDYSSTPTSAWDGGNVKISTDGGNNFSLIVPLGGYPSTVSSSSNVLNGEGVYSGVSTGWELAEFDLSTFAGQTIFLKFDFGTDGSVTEAGWYVDTVVVNSEMVLPSSPVNLTVQDNQDLVVLSWNEATKNLLGEDLKMKQTINPVKERLSSIKELENSDNPVVIESTEKGMCFKVYKSIDGISFTMNEVTFDTTCTDTAVVVGNTYYYFVTSAVGILESLPSDTITVTVGSATGLDSEIGQTTPTVFALNQNYPNPFNPNTKIQFSIPKTSMVSLRIYNVLGQEISTLVSEKLNPGIYTFNWDAAGYASGVYFYKLEAGGPSTGSGSGIIKIKKMILLR